MAHKLDNDLNCTAIPLHDGEHRNFEQLFPTRPEGYSHDGFII